jgi:putative membrane protein
VTPLAHLSAAHAPEVLVLAAAGCVYALGVRRLWGRGGRGTGVAGWQAACFAGGLAALAVALLPPLDALAHELFSAHMAQHMLLVLVAAPLLALGRPLLPLLFALPPASRRRVSPAAAALASVTDRTGWPLAALALHAGVLWLWHAPALYDAALASPAVHAVEHATLLATAVAFWAAIVASGLRRRIGHATAVLVVFASALQSGGLGALITFAGSPLYGHHAAATAARGGDPLADQQLAGVLMWVPGGLVYVAAATALLLSGLAAVEQRALRRELGRSTG